MSSNRLEGNRLSLTNNYSIISKYSASKQGHFVDPILEDFLEYVFRGDGKLSTRRAAQVNLGYAARQMAMDLFVNQNYQVCQTGCFIILGAGFDMLSQRPRTSACHWIEIDLPNVIEAKRNYIKDKLNVEEGDVFVSNDGNVVSFIQLRLHLISCDLRDGIELISRLRHAFKNVPTDKRNRVTILNEVCLCYLEESEVGLILELIRDFLANERSHFMYYIGFEQVKPPGPSHFAKLMSNHFNELGFPLRNFPTRDKLLDLFTRKLKFRNMTVIPMYQIFHNILMPSSSEKNLRDRDPFDEYEELDLYLGHYALVMGQCNLRSDCNIAQEDMEISEGDDLIEGIRDMSFEQRSGFEVSLRFDNHISRYGHASCALEDNSDGGIALITGGYGHLDGSTAGQYGQSNQRMKDCALLIWEKVPGNPRMQRLFPLKGIDFGPEMNMGRMHGQVCHLENGLVFFNGGRQNPRKTIDSSDNSFIGHVDKSQHTLRMVKKMNATNSLRWRHRTLRLNCHQLIQVGGILGKIYPDDEGAIGMWNLSSDKLGFSSVLTDRASQDLALDRHSFGADLRDENSLLIFGGLIHSWPYDRPVNSTQAVLMVDLRCPEQPIQLECLGQGYDLHVHFLNDCQFVRYGGISTATGLFEDYVDLYDLRRSNQGLPVAKSRLSENSEVNFIPTKMTSVHFKQAREIISLGGGGTYFTFGSQFNNCHHKINYDGL